VCASPRQRMFFDKKRKTFGGFVFFVDDEVDAGTGK
jgi:uncharacterized protein YbaA (DUF1428 family)